MTSSIVNHVMTESDITRVSSAVERLCVTMLAATALPSARSSMTR